MGHFSNFSDRRHSLASARDVPLAPAHPANFFFTIPERARAHVVQTTKCNPSRQNFYSGARTHNHKVKGCALCRLS
jgi:hypothetical protein